MGSGSWPGKLLELTKWATALGVVGGTNPGPPEPPKPIPREIKPTNSSKLHGQMREQIAKRFGVRVDHWSKPRKMRGSKSGEASGKLSRHSFGRALDVYYENTPQKDDIARWLIQNGARMILDYEKNQSWVRGRGWKKSDLSGKYKHLHVEFD